MIPVLPRVRDLVLVIPKAVERARVLISVRVGLRDLALGYLIFKANNRKVPRSYSGVEDHPSKPESGLPGAPGRKHALIDGARDDATIMTAVIPQSTTEKKMSTLGFIEYEKANAEVRAVYDDIMATRKTDKVTNFWKALAHDPVRLKRTWEDTKQIMAAGVLDPLVKELIYVAVSITNQCDYCIAAHTVSARKKGMSDAIFNEMLAVVGLANENNRLVAGLQVEIDEHLKAIG